MKVFTDILNTLAIIYVALPILALVVLGIVSVAGKTPAKEWIEKLLEFGKWYMVAVAIVFAAKIVDSSFTDRETSIKEIAIYEKYASTILEADNIEKRWKLAEYFAAVTPSAELRNRWIEYKTLLKPEYDAVQELKVRRNQILASGPDSLLTEAKKEELLNIEEKISSIDSKLTNTVSEGAGFIIIFTADINQNQAEYENLNLKKAGVDDALILNKGKFYYNISKEYGTRAEASRAKEGFGRKIRTDAYITTAASFCPNRSKSGEIFICQ